MSIFGNRKLANLERQALTVLRTDFAVLTPNDEVVTMATNAMLKAGGNEYDVAVFFMVNFLDGLADGVAIPMTDNTMLLIDTSLVKVIMMLDRAAIARDYCERLMPKIKRKAMDNLIIAELDTRR